MQNLDARLDQTTSILRRNPCKTCGAETLHRNTICVHCGTTTLAKPENATERRYNRWKRGQAWQRMHVDKRAELARRAEESRRKFEGC